jgi:uncharacterized protein YfaS (alpha-2-macroglobulin family)/tetratricopeptide (TPR) repeat protein
MRLSRFVLGIVVLLNAGQPAASAADNPRNPRPAITSLPRIQPALHDLLQSQKFAEAIKQIDAELTREKVAGADYLLYLKGRAQTQLRLYPQALATFAALQQKHPDSRWLPRSRFGRADVLVQQRNYRAAGQIYQAEARRLLSSGRKDQLASIYLEFADRYFDGIPSKDPSGKKRPDFKQALTYYAQALKLQPSLQSRQRIELRIARCRQELKKLTQAIADYRKFLDRYASDKTQPDQHAAAALQVEARYQLGRAQLRAGQSAEARKTWQDFLNNDVAQNVGGDLLAQAAYSLALTYGIPKPSTAGNLELGVTALEKFLKDYPEHKLAAKAEFEIAQSYVHHGRHEQAIARLKSLIANQAYESTVQAAEARRLLGRSYFAQKKFDEAIAAWREFLDKHPTNRHWSSVQLDVVNSEYQAAEEQRRRKNYQAARKLWATFLNKYPLDPRAPRILLRFGQMNDQAAVVCRADDAKKAKTDGDKRPVEISDACRQLFEAAIADWNRLVSKYPGTKEASQAAHMIGVTLEDQLSRLTDALAAYKKVKGRYANAAKKRIANLTAKQLELITERKFRSDEQPRIKLFTRNIKKVSIKLYRIDMPDYFRKMHLATGVETLDIALIDPDKSWEYEVAGYEPYRRLTNEVSIPVEKAGVTAVTVSSEKLEATTMIVVSNLDIIVKSSRNELFVFAENMRTGKPAGGVSLLVSDGKEIFAEELTGDDGVLQKSYDRLKSVKDLRVFAIHEGHAASTVSSLAGLDFAVGLSPKGYLYTDRPGYRPGQLVNLKGIVRWVNQDRYTFKQGETFQLHVYDSRGRVIHQQKVSLNRFGTFADNFVLPKSAAQGGYRVHLHQPGGKQSYETSFRVHEFKLEPIHLTVDLPRRVYYRGEKIEGTIRLKYYYGTPIAGRTVQYQLDGERLHTATTDAKGEVKFEFPTQRYSESQALQLIVRYPERGLATAPTIYLATRGFGIGVTTLRNVYVSGETFDTTLIVTDPAGKPVATNLKLEVFEQTVSNGKRGERLVEKHEVKSAKETGQVRHTLRVDKAGRYVLRATGTDRFGNRISGSQTLMISGDEDKIRLRILAEKHHYQSGDRARVQLHWRERPALALVTYEGASILGYQLVELQRGANPLEIPLESKLAPNFVLSVAVMERNHFHQARSEFRVSRKLNVSLKPHQTTLKPGAELTVDVTVTDPQGRPVSAELSLGLVQKNLLDLFTGSRAVVDEFFGDGYRKPSVRAASSCTFRYRPKTRGISQFLLAETERKKILEMDFRARRELEEIAKMEAAQKRAILEASSKLLDLDIGFAYGNQNGRRFELFDSNGDGIDNDSLFRDGSASARASEQHFGFGERVIRGGSIVGLSINGVFVPGLTLRGPQSQQSSNALRSHTIRNLSSLNIGQLRRRKGNLFPSGSGGGFAGNGIQSAGQNYGLPKLVLHVEYSEHSLNELSWGGSVREFRKKHFHVLSNANGTIVALTSAGEFQVVNGLTVATLQKLAKEGLRLLPRQATSETGYWNPVVVTDEDGKATVKFRLPNRSTAWKLRSKGINLDTLTGEAEVEIISKKDLFGELKTPLAFTKGDEANVLVEVHNSTVKKGGKIEVRLKTTLGDRSTELKKTITSQGPGLQELSFPVTLTESGTVKFKLSVAGGELSDVTRVSIPVKPYGMPVFATVSGSSAQNTIVFVEHNKKLAVEDPSLEIIIGPSINRTLLEAVLGGGISRYELSLPRSGLERTISDALGGVSLLTMIRGSRTSDSPEAQALAGRVQSAISGLVSAQRKDGGWSWTGRPDAKKSDRYITSRAVWALSQARKSGFAVPQDTFDKSVKFLQSAFTAGSRSDREGQAILLHGLTEAGSGDFAFANRLYRERNSLSPSGLLHVALALARLDRKQMAQEMLDLVKISTDPKTANQSSRDAALGKVIPWMQSGVELRALYLLALEEIKPAGPKSSQLADWLMAARQGSRWAPEKANGPVIAALSQWFGRTKPTNEKYTLSVFVNDRLVEKLEIDPTSDGSRRLEVPRQMLVKGKPQQINLDVEGRGRFSYSAVLGGFVPAEKLASTTSLWRVKRTYEPARRMLDGQIIPRGFSVLTGGYTSFKNPMTQLPMGERGEVTLNVYRQRDRRDRNKPLDYLVVTEPIPAGTMVLTDTIRGGFERYEISPGVITFYVGAQPYVGNIRYTLVGYLPGQYRAAPTVVRSFYQPGRIAVAGSKSLELLPRGAKSKDKYRLTPVELYEFGKRLTAKRRNQEADGYLTQLFRNYRLRAKIYQEVVRLLFQTSLANNKDEAIVEYFEIIKEKYPEVEIDFASILKVGQAYQELGEYERSYLVFRATVEASFERESQIAGFLDNRGEFLRSVQVVERLLRDYPAEAYIAIATYALAQEVYGKALEAAEHKQLRAAKIGRVDLIATSIRMLDHFLSTWSKDPAADQASFSLASALLDLEQYDGAISRCRKFAERYPDSKLLDSFWYVIGYSQFALGRHEAALEMCSKVAKALRKDPRTGVDVAAANKWQAIYIMGQVYHSLGKPAKAIAEYKRVKDRFSDAGEAIDFFSRKDIKLPEITTVKPGEPLKVPLKFRNVANANVKVYRIDLLKFGLMQRNLNRITAINLAGIRPYHELTLDLGDGHDYRDREQPLQLPLKEEGAYLVVCRGENLYTSGLVLISPLSLEIQEDAQSSRVRVTVKNVVNAHYVHKVHVKVIGSANQQFISGETDLRGIFAADAIRGTSTVIAKVDQNRYAFYRGTKVLGNVALNDKKSNRKAARKKLNSSKRGVLLDNIIEQNGIFNSFQRSNYRNLLNNDNSGVKAKLAF